MSHVSCLTASPLLLASVLVSVGLNANAQTPAPEVSREGFIDGLPYGIWSRPDPDDELGDGDYIRNLEIDFSRLSNVFNYEAGVYWSQQDNDIWLNYYNADGFKGVYSYEGKTGTITADVSIDISMDGHTGSNALRMVGYIGKERNIIMAGRNLGYITVKDTTDRSYFGSRDRYSSLGNYTNDVYLSNDKLQDSGGLRYIFSNNSTGDFPSHLGGELWIRGFSQTNSGFDSDDNSLTGVFVAHSELPGGGSRNTSIRHLFSEEISKHPFLDEDIDTLLEPANDLETSSAGVLTRENGASNVWYANPHVNLPENGKYGLNIDKPVGIGGNRTKINEEELASHLLESVSTLHDKNNATDNEITSGSLRWISDVQQAVDKGYLEGNRHEVGYSLGELEIGIGPSDGSSEIAYYHSTEHKVVIGEDWLTNLYQHYLTGDFDTYNNVLNSLTSTIADFNYRPPQDYTGSTNIISTRDELTSKIAKDSPIGEYGVWLTQTFRAASQDELDDGDYRIKDSIEAYGFITTSNSDETIPSGSATYSGTDNFIGVDMSAHYLGSVLRADANLIYNFDSTGSTIDLTVDEFEVYHKGDWIQQNGSITYDLSCDGTGCRDNEDMVGVSFYQNGQYVGGSLIDLEDEYVGSFVAEREPNINPYSGLIDIITR